MSEPLLEELRRCLDALEVDGELSAAQLSAMLERLKEQGPSLSAEDVAFAVEVLGSLEEQVRLQMADVDGQLRSTIEAQRALRGYAHLRGHTLQQRLNRRA